MLKNVDIYPYSRPGFKYLIVRTHSNAERIGIFMKLKHGTVFSILGLWIHLGACMTFGQQFNLVKTGISLLFDFVILELMEVAYIAGKVKLIAEWMRSMKTR